ncbi:MOSC domain-containing protein [Streptomyces sp. NBC_01142]|uniref:MOSC domain-containing protein n=1 Tax=Streptomyces sp. NBC_01142 TaxID=2975865 RepID=UPI0022521254|nr:MOSC N-terminal beta barrel domain-containing protein [Streptomyces sp. NBC_01142]MCX4825139.1 MOSC domain-containing protein [Streptomyces sp. NBC_01142]
MPKPVLHSVHVHPVKSVAGCAPGEAAVEPWGLAGDRRWTLIDSSAKVVTQRQQPRLALACAEPLPDGGIRLTAPGHEPLTVAVPEPVGTISTDVFGDKVEAVPVGRPVNAWFSDYLGAEVQLVHLDDPAHRRPLDPAYARSGETVNFGDSSPLLVTTLSSLDALNSLIAQGDHADEGPLPMSRFRPNVVVGGVAPWAEDEWRRISIGEAVFRVMKPCGRCVVTTTDQRTAERGKEPLRTLARHRRIGDRLAFGVLLVPERTGIIRVSDAVTVVD